MAGASPATDVMSPAGRAQLFCCLENYNRIALAVSGGSDSMALLTLVLAWRAMLDNPPFICVLSVDHGLRAGSADEVRQVGAWCQALGVDHAILPWRRPGDVGGNMQAKARQARYRLMSRWCLEQDMDCLLTGHHLNDQAETFLMRLKKGSGVYGLAAMAPVSRHYGIDIVRPLLDVEKTGLQNFLRHIGQGWIEDPSNWDQRFERVRVRALMTQLAALGLTATEFGETVRRLRRARVALEASVDAHLANVIRWQRGGAIAIDGAGLSAVPEEVGLRAVMGLVRVCGGSDGPLALAAAEKFYRALQRPDYRGSTLAGCRVLVRQDGLLFIRETGRNGLESCALNQDKPLLWDRRFVVRAEGDHKGLLSVGPLGVAGLREIRRNRPHYAGPLPAVGCHVLPAFWHADRLAAVPHMDYVADYVTDFAQNFRFEARFAAGPVFSGLPAAA